MTGTPACFALTSAPVASFGSSDTSKIALAPLVMAFSTSDCCCETESLEFSTTTWRPGANCCRSWVNRGVSWVSHRGVAASGTRKYTSPLSADAEVPEPVCVAVELCELLQAAIPSAMTAAETAHFTFLFISLPLYRLAYEVAASSGRQRGMCPGGACMQRRRACLEPSCTQATPRC